ncbi:hypothetical protein T08_14983 [Trichinella sp. T8]|nr:hypothetical protein T08_14983 [Trichinella sp. T8]
MDDKKLLIKTLNVPPVSQVFMVAISLYRPCAHLPGNFQRDLFYQSQPELLNLSTLHPAAFFILYQNKEHMLYIQHILLNTPSISSVYRARKHPDFPFEPMD